MLLPSVATAASSKCPEGDKVKAQDLDKETKKQNCDLSGRVIVDVDASGMEVVGAKVPEAGTSVYVIIDFLDAPTQSLIVTTTEDGSVVLGDQGPESEEAQPSQKPGRDAEGSQRQSHGLTECNDNANTNAGHRWNRELEWFFKSSTSPAGLSVTNVAIDLADGMNTFPITRNICGFGDVIARTHAYRGNTLDGSDIDAAGFCFDDEPERLNVIDFGVLPGNSTGAACTLRDTAGIALEMGIKLDRWDYPWFTGGVPAGCTNAVSIKGVVAHESGHVWGLGHVDEGLSPYLTMSPIGARCDISETTLGLGDVQGVQVKN